MERELLTDRERGQLHIGDKLTVASFFNKWLELEVKHQLRPRTVYQYSAQIKNICSRLGGIQLNNLTVLQLKAYCNEELARGITASSLGTELRILKRALKKAKEWHLIVENPCEYLQLPKPTETKNAVFSPQQVEQFLTAIKKTTLYLPCLFGFLCGLRRGEICGLRWQDISLERNSAHICHSYDRNPLTGKAELGQVKTPASKADIALPGIVINALKAEQARQKEHQHELGTQYQHLDFVWAKPDGRPFLPDYLYTTFIKLVKQSGLPLIRPHDMRHTFATLLWESGLDDKYIATAARHANASFTRDYYVHLRPPLKARYAETIDSLFKNKLEKN